MTLQLNGAAPCNRPAPDHRRFGPVAAQSVPERKLCARCGETKPLGDFNRNRKAADGHSSYCRPCQHAYTRAWRVANPERKREQQRRYRERHPDVIAAQRKEWRRTNREKNLAHQRVHEAVKSGRLTRPDACEACGTTQALVQAHHADYARPLDVRWLCPSCHCDAHGWRA